MTIGKVFFRALHSWTQMYCMCPHGSAQMFFYFLIFQRKFFCQFQTNTNNPLESGIWNIARAGIDSMSLQLQYIVMTEQTMAFVNTKSIPICTVMHSLFTECCYYKNFFPSLLSYLHVSISFVWMRVRVRWGPTVCLNDWKWTNSGQSIVNAALHLLTQTTLLSFIHETSKQGRWQRKTKILSCW